MNIHGSEHPIKKIFSDDFVFTIPLYQRAYAWTTEESEELLQDLMRAMDGYEGSIDDLPPYFLGSIVLIKGDEPLAEVIDGQQRLTTLIKYVRNDFGLQKLQRMTTLKKYFRDLSEDHQSQIIDHQFPDFVLHTITQSSLLCGQCCRRGHKRRLRFEFGDVVGAEILLDHVAVDRARVDLGTRILDQVSDHLCHF